MKDQSIIIKKQQIKNVQKNYSAKSIPQSGQNLSPLIPNFWHDSQNGNSDSVEKRNFLLLLDRSAVFFSFLMPPCGGADDDIGAS